MNDYLKELGEICCIDEQYLLHIIKAESDMMKLIKSTSS